MDKKFGVSVGLLSALCFFAAYSNWLASVVLLVAILVFSSEYILKKNAVSATVFAILIVLVRSGLSFLSTSFHYILDFLNLIFGQNSYEFTLVISKIRFFDLASNLTTIINFVFFVITIFFVIKALKGGEVKVPFFNKMIEKHLSKEEA